MSDNAVIEEVDVLTQHQLMLEELYSKNQLMPRIKKEFTEAFDGAFITFFQENEIPEAFGLTMLAQIALHKRADLKTMVGVTRVHADNCQHAVDLLLKCAELDLIDYDDRFQTFIVKYMLDEQTQLELDQYQFPLPMVVKPKHLTKNTQSGYLLTKSSIILKDNHTNDDVVLDHINRMNQVNFCHNMTVASMVQNEWSGLDKPKEDETKQDYEKRVRAFQKYDRVARDVLDLLTQNGNSFYFTHRYDKRGRIYCQGYHTSYQGNSWNKAILELVEEEVIE